MRAPITLDLHLPNFNYPDVPPERLFDKLTEIARTAEASGFSTLTVMDHFHQIRGVGPRVERRVQRRRDRVQLRHASHVPPATTSRQPARARTSSFNGSRGIAPPGRCLAQTRAQSSSDIPVGVALGARVRLARR